jgi:hypothetical protein
MFLSKAAGVTPNALPIFVRSAIAVLLIGLSLGLAAEAQHQHSAGMTQINGKDHPELIPDNVVLNAFLEVAGGSANDTPTDRARRGFQMNRLSQMGMTGQDKAALTQIFAQYKAKAAAITAAFNQTAQATIENGGTVEIETVLQQQADLMKAMQQEIASTLSTDGETFFLRFVQQEKAGIVLITK